MEEETDIPNIAMEPTEVPMHKKPSASSSNFHCMYYHKAHTIDLMHITGNKLQLCQAKGQAHQDRQILKACAETVIQELDAGLSTADAKAKLVSKLYSK